MLYDILRAHPTLGSFLYGHWEGFEIGTVAFLVMVFGFLALALALLLGGVVGYVLQSVALVGIAKKHGAWRNIRIMACLPFARYFAIGKLAERCDAMGSERQKPYLWGRILLIVCCLSIPVTAVALVLAAIGLPGTQLAVMFTESMDALFGTQDSLALSILVGVIVVVIILNLLPLLLLNGMIDGLIPFVMIVLPFVGLVCLLVGVALLALTRTLCGICYSKVLRTYFSSKTATVLAVVGAVSGLSPIILLVARCRNNRI